MATPGRWLRQARRRAGLTQRALSERAQIPQATIARIEAGSVDPRVGTLAALLEACGETLRSATRLSDGVDRGHINLLLDLSPAERVAYVMRSSEALAEILPRR